MKSIFASYKGTAAWLVSLFFALPAFMGTARATDISGAISTTLTVMQDSRLIGNVSCMVSGAPCIVIGASGVTFDLNGFSITGLGDPVMGCSGAAVGGEVGILVNAVNNVVIRGRGMVQQFRNHGIQLLTSTGSTVTGVIASTNCNSGIILTGGSGHLVEHNTSIRNGSPGAACGGI